MVQIGGRFSKDAIGGPIAAADAVISTAALNRVLAYEPRDLTISVEAGLPWTELASLLARNGQELPLDPPFAGGSTAGGVVASNLSGPRRRLYGTARDFVIGMTYATADGRLVQSGGMVVKNVAGLDTAKLMIGSLGTLAAIAVVNFKVIPKHASSRWFVLSFDCLRGAIEARDRVLGGVLQPAAVDLLNPAAARRLGFGGYILLVGVGGSPAVLDRYARELGPSAALADEADLIEFTPRFLCEEPAGAVVRVSCLLSQLREVLEGVEVPVVARAGSGVCYLHFASVEEAAVWLGACPWNGVVEFAPPAKKAGLDLWPRPGGDLELMRRVKDLFDPRGALNPGRLYGRL